jgi:hypothetical protein
MAIIIPVFIFFILLNPSGLAEEFARGWGTNRYFALAFLLPGIFGLLVEGSLQSRIRRLGSRESFLCVLRNFAAGLLGLALASAGFLATPWFDSWGARSVYLAVFGLIGVTVLLLGGYLNVRAPADSSLSRTRPGLYLSNAAAVAASGVVGILFGLAMRWIYDLLRATPGAIPEL